MHQSKDIDWMGGWEHAHICTSTYHITLCPKLYAIISYCEVHYVSIMACNCDYFLFFVWLLTMKTDKHLSVLWLYNCYLLSEVCCWNMTNMNLTHCSFLWSKIIFMCIVKVDFEIVLPLGNTVWNLSFKKIKYFLPTFCITSD